MNINQIGGIIWAGLVSGVIATAAMTLFLSILTKTGLVHADMVRAIGSMVKKSMDNAFRTGIIIHFSWGIFFAICYTIILSTFNIHSILNATVVGMLIGFVHGFSVSLLLVVAVAEYHPIEQFRNPGIAVAVAHFAAHLIYGTIVGLVASLVGY